MTVAVVTQREHSRGAPFVAPALSAAAVSATPVSARSAHAYPEPRAVGELLKPLTWFPPAWAFACGVVSVGGATVGVRSATPAALALGVCVAGPLVCGASQAVNDWFDRHVDAINEPARPIPSGRVPGRWGLAVAIAWSALALAAGLLLGPIGAAATGVALVLAWAYSAPPVRLKQNGWYGNLAVGVCYEGVAWVTGALVAAGGTMPAARVLALAVLYSLGAHGIMTLNDFKSVEGDRRFGIRSLPVQHGPRGAAWVACGVMLVPQLVVIALLASWHARVPALIVSALLVVQLVLMRRFLGAVTPRSALLYSGIGVPFYVCGMMAAAVGVRA